MTYDPRIIGALQNIDRSLKTIATHVPGISEAIKDLRDEIEEASKASVQQQEQIIGNIEGLREDVLRTENR